MCRHRGSRIAAEPRGRSRSLVCPHHQWIYKLDDCLANARLMGGSFDPDEYRLCSAAVRELAGLVFVCLVPEPPDFDATLEREYERWRDLGLEPEESSFRGGSPYRVSRLPLKKCFLTESLDGGLVAPLMGDLTDPRTGSLRIITPPTSGPTPTATTP